MWGRLFHFTADAILVSTVLAGIKRNVGLQPATNQIENEEIKKYAEKYLDIGEWVMDTSIGFMNNSPYFERKK
ncbi:hypothetical protein G6F57_000280 [Rhizopus arrhizus]|uniref:DUF1748-domain-containing protein n=1 Tax=Rhizopus oryzae TaxID=64495 RepID=A0A9P6X4K7_RHIOR|nr:hypothetical protein G6F23_011100 [Rhizopus arrhizus]KAG1417223.1 hypothetical protein G6F58_005613 [Rhizopus delemar]KAG0759898.1 hypothetical protein G6F24_008733 [Rhizopus arrhizus]KAG0782999.1 hypothetical protein G6F22_008869 [Rhizopus arrhizus]KAG0792421.1 hypothetical protein G6F21_004367 [Rhizopus arrhizus]